MNTPLYICYNSTLNSTKGKLHTKLKLTIHYEMIAAEEWAARKLHQWIIKLKNLLRYEKLKRKTQSTLANRIGKKGL